MAAKRSGPRCAGAAAGRSGLATYDYLSAVRADFLRQLHQWRQAAEAYEEALTLTDNDVEYAFLSDRLGEVRPLLPT